MVWACIKINFESRKEKIDFFLSRKSPKKSIPPPPPFFKMKLEDPEPILKVYIPVFQPPGHCIDGLGLY